MRQLQIVKSSKGQMKIQEMAFVLVAIVIFFALVALFYVSIRVSSLKQDATRLNDESAKEVVKSISSLPEFSSHECDNCIDLDKAIIIKNEKAYQNFWNLDYLKIERVYPNDGTVECTEVNYPNCTTITIKSSKEIGTPNWAFVALCRHEASDGGYSKCELGRIYASGKGIQ